MPKDVPWHGKTVHTGIWKEPAAGPRMVRRLDIDGEGQIRSNSPPPTRCLEARCRALVSEGQAAEGLYREAIDRLSRTRIRAALPDLDPIPVPA